MFFPMELNLLGLFRCWSSKGHFNGIQWEGWKVNGLGLNRSRHWKTHSPLGGFGHRNLSGSSPSDESAIILSYKFFVLISKNSCQLLKLLITTTFDLHWHYNLFISNVGNLFINMNLIQLLVRLCTAYVYPFRFVVTCHHGWTNLQTTPRLKIISEGHFSHRIWQMLPSVFRKYHPQSQENRCGMDGSG